MKKIIIMILMFSVSLMIYGEESKESKNILILNSYSYDYPLTEKIMKGIMENFDQENIEANFQVEYLETRKMLDQDYYNKVAEIYKYKFQRIKFDVIICSDNEALLFIIKNRKELFFNIPVVFCGINGYEKKLLHGDAKITGITEELAVSETIDLATKLHLGTKRILVLNDRTESGKMFRFIIEKEQLNKKFDKQLVFLDDFDLGLDEIPAKVKELSKDSVLLFTFFTTDKDKKKISNGEVLKKIMETTSIPIYGLYEAFLEDGIIGGKLVSRYKQGVEAGNYAIKILKGTNVEDIPIMVIKPDKFIFEYSALKKQDINIKKLPKESIVLNKPLTIYEKIKSILIYIILFFLSLFAIIILLINVVFKTKKINKIIEISRQKAEENITFVRSVINSAPSMYSVKDKQGRIILANKAFADFFNLELESIEGKSLVEIFANLNFNIEIAKKMTREDLRVIEENIEISGIEEKIVSFDNEIKWLYSKVVPLKIEGLEEYCSLRVSLDISKRKNTELELKKSKEEAERASIAKGHFLATMSHEIRTPLNGVVSMIEQIKNKKGMEAIKREIEIMDISSKRLVDVIDKVLNLSKIEYGEMEFETREFDIRKEVKNSILLFEEKIKEKKIDILVYVDREIPRILKGDLVKYHQIITNIIGNAIKFTGEGYIFIEITNLFQDGDNLTIRTQIKDTGIGIDKENFDKIFNKFSQVRENSEEKTNGVGLGLAIAKELVERMDGNISLESEIGRGTKFIIDIPLKKIKENRTENFLHKEIIVLCDKKEYFEFYTKTLRNFRELSSIFAQDLEELTAIVESTDELNDVYLIVDSKENVNGISSKVKTIFIGSDKDKVARYNLEEKLNLLLTEKEMKSEGNLKKEKFEKIWDKKILIVEDDEISREVLIILLRSFGITDIKTAYDGEKAIELYLENYFDLIFMDLQLPNIDGYETVKKIREIESVDKREKVNVIALTASVVEEHKDRCLREGFDEYLTKPIKQNLLMEKMSYFFEYNAINFDKLKAEFTNNEELLKELLNSFIKNIPDLLAEFNSSFETDNYEQMLKMAHKIKGAVGNIRAEKLYKFIEEIELLLKMKDYKKAIILLNKINKEMENLKFIIIKYIKK